MAAISDAREVTVGRGPAGQWAVRLGGLTGLWTELDCRPGSTTINGGVAGWWLGWGARQAGPPVRGVASRSGVEAESSSCGTTTRTDAELERFNTEFCRAEPRYRAGLEEQYTLQLLAWLLGPAAILDVLLLQDSDSDSDYNPARPAGLAMAEEESSDSGRSEDEDKFENDGKYDHEDESEEEEDQTIVVETITKKRSYDSLEIFKAKKMRTNDSSESECEEEETIEENDLMESIQTDEDLGSVKEDEAEKIEEEKERYNEEEEEYEHDDIRMNIYTEKFIYENIPQDYFEDENSGEKPCNGFDGLGAFESPAA